MTKQPYMKVREFLDFTGYLAGMLGGTTRTNEEMLQEAERTEPRVEAENFTPTNLWAEVYNSSSMGLTVRVNQYPDRSRVWISGYYPRDEEGNNQTSSRDGAPEISISLAKATDPARWPDIFKDINRRLWPGYLKALEIVRGRIAQVREINNRVDSTRKALDRYGAKIYGQDKRHFDIRAIGYDQAAELEKGEIRLSGRVACSLDLPVEVALTVFEIMATYNKKHQPQETA